MHRERSRLYRLRTRSTVTTIETMTDTETELVEETIIEESKMKFKLQSSEFAELAVPLQDESLINSSTITSFKTPSSNHRPAYRQRCWSARKKLSKNPDIRAAQGVNLLVKVMTSPSTCDLAASHAKSNQKFQNIVKTLSAGNDKEGQTLFRQVRQIATYRSKKQYKKIGPLVTNIRNKYSLRSVAKITKMTYSQVHWMCSEKKSKKNLKRKITEKQRNAATMFFDKTDVSMQLPYRRFAHFRYMRSPMAQAYQEYSREQRKLGNRVLSKSALHRILGKNMKAMKMVPYKECMCSTCLNYGLKADALKAKNVKGLEKRATLNVLQSMCKPSKTKNNIVVPESKPRSFAKRAELRKKVVRPQSANTAKENPINTQFVISSRLEKKIAAQLSTVTPNTVTPEDYTISDCDRKCIYRECKNCGKHKIMTYILEQNTDLDLREEAVYHEWKNIIVEETKKQQKKKLGKVREKATTVDDEPGTTTTTRRDFGKVREKTTIGALLDLWCAETMKMSTHLFNFKWQASQFELCKRDLDRGSILMVMDFAQNVAHRKTWEAQSAHWHRKQSTLHPVVCYYRCPSCKSGVVHDEILCITDDLTHDASAVEAFVKESVEHLKDFDVPIKEVIQYTDNCCSQYKCYHAFDLISRWSIPIERHYFGAQHGKGPADSCIGRVVRQVASAVKTEKEEISDGLDYALHCMSNMTTPCPESNKCQHFQRHFKYIHKISRRTRTHDDSLAASTLPGTQKIHCIKSTGTRGIVEYRASSCFCR